MKKILLTIILTMYLLVSININANATEYTDNNINEPNIEEIVINVPSNINIYKGDKFGINIKTIDIELYNAIQYTIENNILTINCIDDRLFEEYLDYPENIKINIQLPTEIKNIKTNSNMLVAIVQKNNTATNNEKH